MKFTFPARKDKALGGFHVEIRRNGQYVAEVWSAGTKAEAVREAREHAELYGYIDGVSQ